MCMYTTSYIVIYAFCCNSFIHSTPPYSIQYLLHRSIYYTIYYYILQLHYTGSLLRLRLQTSDRQQNYRSSTSTPSIYVHIVCTYVSYTMYVYIHTSRQLCILCTYITYMYIYTHCILYIYVLLSSLARY